MAIRYRLHHKHLDDFRAYLIGKGWVIEDTKGMFEVLRAKHPDRKRPLIIYTKLDAKEHYSVDDRDWKILNDFLRVRKGGD